MENLFLQIIAGELPSTKVYEDEHTLVILDINPHSKGHLLVMPKKKHRNIFDIPDETLCEMIKITKKLALAVVKTLNADGVNFHMNNEEAAGQEVMHAHIHIVPRFKGDGVYASPKHLSYKEGEKEELAEKIQKNID